jgi:two-component system, OmpR family, sensor histidine kinase KdpD
VQEPLSQTERGPADDSGRGHHRVLLGAAAGVGKTYRMLLEGKQAASVGVDVVIGYLEPHDRPDTIALADGLEQVAPRPAEEAGARPEMDVDGVVRRAPELALVDELAHTNARGSRNRKRYEDIGEVLTAGIDVISTVNIQHLESLNDLVFELTGVRVRETFPDRILDEADEVVLVDLTPEELRDRIGAGKVYPPERVGAALANFFRTENLQSLRQLALREVAEDVEERRVPQRAAGDTNPLIRQALRERILVLVEASPRSQRLLRRAWRSGQRLGADIDALWVHPPGQSLDEDGRIAVAAVRRLAVLLGVHFLEEEDRDPVQAIARAVADRRSTYVFLSRPEDGRLDRLLGRSRLEALLDALPGVDVRICADAVDRPGERR